MTESTDSIQLLNTYDDAAEKTKVETPAAEEAKEEVVEAPVEEAAEEEVPEPEDLSDKPLDELPLPEETDGEEKKKKLPKWADKRLSRKEREVEDAKAESAALRAQLEAAQRQPAPVDNAPQTYLPSMPEPAREDYESDIAWVRAVNKYDTEKAQFQQGVENFNRQNAERAESFNKKYKSVVDAGAEKYEDFEEKTAFLAKPGFPSNPMMAEAIFDSPFKDDIWYFLGTYKEKAREIALMSPVEAVKKIAELEMRFKSKKPSEVSKSPKVIAPLKGGKTASAPPDKNDVVKVAESGTQQQFEDLMRSIAKKKNKF